MIVEDLATADLALFHRNPRRGDVAAIAESLQRTGQYKPIVVNLGSLTGRPREVLAGNHTLLAARRLAWLTVAAVVVDVDEQTADRIVLADNRTADLGGYDTADLASLLQGLDDLTGTGYAPADLTALLRGLNPPVQRTEQDAVPDRPDRAVSAAGDVWELGESRLRVGSCADTTAVLAVLEQMGGPADCVWTDPPYGVDYKGGTGLTIANDSREAAAEVWAAAMPTLLAVGRPGAPVYVAHPDQGRELFLEPMLAAGIRIRQTLLWVKDSLVLGRADYHYRSEPILEGDLPDPDGDYGPLAYGFTPGGKGRLGRGGPAWHGDHKSSNVFEYPKPRASRVHPTMKPTALVEAMLRNSCPPGGIVVDLFAGSGSTLIAAHALQMRALLCELDPLYADVICTRWEEHTGIVPVRDGRPVSFTGAAA